MPAAMNNLKNQAKSFDLSGYLNNHQDRINRHLAALLSCGPEPTRLCAAMCHCLMAPGKRLRPVLCMAAAEAAGVSADKAVLQAGCAIEMIHTYSLIHDDLPAMDDDQLRRGRPTCHVAFDEATAILAGDALLTLAFETLAGCAKLDTANAAGILESIDVISKAAGYCGMIEGQMQDMAGEGQGLALGDLKQMHELKTGALIRASVETGGLLAGADEAGKQALKTYAGHIGLAFQVTDDILNIRGDPDRMGKASGTDTARAKSTYPSLMGIDAARDYAADLISKALQTIEIFGNKATPLAALAAYIVERDK